MAWKCPQCGFDSNADDSSVCAGCGFTKFPRGIRLTTAGGETIEFSIETAVGKYMLKNPVGEESKYASEEQFRIVKNHSSGKWAVEHAPAAVNPTFVNGSDISASGKTDVETGSIISIGPDFCKLEVEVIS